MSSLPTFGQACARLAPLSLLACSLLTGPYLAPAPTGTPAAPAAATLPAATPTGPGLASPTARPPAATLPPAPSATPRRDPADIYLDPAHILLHPGPELYSGDRVSFEILAGNPGSQSLGGLPVMVYHETWGGEIIATGRYSAAGIGAREQATLHWAWDTTGLEGAQTVVAAHDPAFPALEADRDLSNNVITMTVQLLPAEALPQPEVDARWARADSACCVFHYLTGTAAERDLPELQRLAAREVGAAQDRLGVALSRPLTFTLLGRLLGHGGFAGESIAISYLDRDYAGGDMPQVFRHESVHILDRQIARTRPVMMTEGLAVYISGGHYKREDLEARAVAVLALEEYIPLAELADDFYPAQHEIGYIQAGAFVQFLVEEHGWEAFRAFYSTFTPGPSDAEVLDAALRLNFGFGLAEAEAAWLAHLAALPVDAAQVADVRDTVAFYDTVRRYQQRFDPAAHYLAAWLPDTGQMRREGIVADYLRHPAAPGNIALEAMLAETATAIGRGDYARAEWLTASVNSVLGAAGPAPGPPLPEAFLDPLAAQYLAVVETALAAGHEPQRIALEGGRAEVAAIRNWPALTTLHFSQAGAAWVLNSD